MAAFDPATSVGPCLTDQTRDGSPDQHLGARRWSDRVTGSDLGPKKTEREQISEPTRNCGPFGPLAETTEMGRGRDREVNTVAERVANPSRRRRVDLSSRKDP